VSTRACRRQGGTKPCRCRRVSQACNALSRRTGPCDGLFDVCRGTPFSLVGQAVLSSSGPVPTVNSDGNGDYRECGHHEEQAVGPGTPNDLGPEREGAVSDGNREGYP
jgi:hypothetical protein